MSRIPLADYARLLDAVKERIRSAQVRAAFRANTELLHLYWDIGRLLAERQLREGWGAAVIPRLARDLHNELPDVKGFSARNIDRMLAFYREYPDLGREFSPLPVAKSPLRATRTRMGPPVVAAPVTSPPVVAKLPEITEQLPVARLPWAHNVLLLQKVKDRAVRRWYMEQTLANGWSRDVLGVMIDSRAQERHGKAVTNFADRLPPPQSDLARQTLKDPYIFDFLTLEESFHERELETSLLRHVQQFLLELGQGFAFVGRQYHLDVGDEDFYIDLLFYHLRLRCFVVIDLKKGAFKPEYAGKMNFYCNVVDDRLRQPADNATIGLILCQDKNQVVAEYALQGVKKAIGVSEYQLTRSLPKELRSSLPSVEQIEAELAAGSAGEGTPGKAQRPPRAQRGKGRK